MRRSPVHPDWPLFLFAHHEQDCDGSDDDAEQPCPVFLQETLFCRGLDGCFNHRGRGGLNGGWFHYRGGSRRWRRCGYRCRLNDFGCGLGFLSGLLDHRLGGRLFSHHDRSRCGLGYNFWGGLRDRLGYGWLFDGNRSRCGFGDGFLCWLGCAGRQRECGKEQGSR